MGALERTLRELARARQKLSEAQAWKAELQARIATTDDGQRLTSCNADIGWHKARVAETEKSARGWTVHMFKMTDNKRPAEGASIRMTKLVDICGDMADVKAWAITSAPHVLQVHVPTLRKQILAGGVPETLAVIKEEPRGALAKDLSSWLTDEHEAPNGEDPDGLRVSEESA